MLLLLVVGCKTVKTTNKSDIDQRNITEVDRSEVSKLTSTGTTVLDVQNNIRMDELFDFSGTYTKWSKPDSTGKQYPEEMGNFKGSKQKITDDKTATKSETENTEVNNITTEEKRNAIMGVKQKTNEKTNTETKVPAGVSWGMIILTMGLLFLLYLVLKRYGIIK